MKKILSLFSAALCLLAGPLPNANAGNITTNDVTATLWPSGVPFTFFDSTSTGGGDTAAATSINFDRSFGTLDVGANGAQVIIRGMGWASGGSGFLATSVIGTFTYLGANGTNGGGDDVIIGKATNNVTANALAGEWVWGFDSPLTNTIDGLSNMFRITLSATGGNLKFKTTGSGTQPASAAKISVAGSSKALNAYDPLGRYWVGNLSATWDTSTANWTDTSSALAYADGTKVTLDDTLDPVALNTNITLSAAHSPTSVLVNNSTYDYSLSGGSLAGAMTLAKSGSAKLALGMSNSYSGVTTINAGILEINHASALGAAASGTVVNSGGALVLNNGITLAGEPLTLNGNGNNLGALHTADAVNPVTVASPITLGSNNPRIQTGLANGQVILTGLITDNGNNYNLNLNAGQGSSILRLNSAGNTVSNVTLYSYLPPPAGGSIIFGASDAFPSSFLLVGGGLFDLNGTSQTFAGMGQGSAPTTGIITNSSLTPATLTIAYFGTTSASFQSAIAGPVSVVKNGTGTQILGGGVNVDHNYSGTTTINAGILALSSDLSLVTNDFIVNSGGTLRGGATIGGSLTVNAGGLYYSGSASNNLGTATILGNLTIQPGATMIACINPDLAPSNSIANVSGTTTYGGTLVVYSIGHTNALKAGDTFTLFPNGGGGSFTNVVFNSIETQPGTTISFDGPSGVVTVTATAAPTLALAALGGGALQINWSSSFYKLQWQTNGLDLGLSDIWYDYPTSNRQDTVIWPNDLAIPATFFRAAPKP